MSEAHEIASFRRRAQRSARTRSRVGTRLPPAPNGCDIQDAQGSTWLRRSRGVCLSRESRLSVKQSIYGSRHSYVVRTGLASDSRRGCRVFLPPPQSPDRTGPSCSACSLCRRRDHRWRRGGCHRPVLGNPMGVFRSEPRQSMRLGRISGCWTDSGNSRGGPCRVGARAHQARIARLALIARRHTEPGR